MNLEALEIIQSGLKVLTQEDLQPFPKLKGIWINDNKIATLDSDLFQHNPLLITVFFDDNNIRFIAENIFDSLDNLKAVYLQNNVCISKTGITKQEINSIVWDIMEKCHHRRQQVDSCEMKEIENAHLKFELKQAQKKLLEIKKNIVDIAHF